MNMVPSENSYTMMQALSRAISDCRIAGDILQSLCYFLMFLTSGKGSFVSTRNWNYFDAVAGSYRDRRKGNTGTGVRLWEYPDLAPGKASVIRDCIHVYHSTLGWHVGVDSPSVPLDEFREIAESAVQIAYPAYHACLKVEDLNPNRDFLTGAYTRRKFFQDARAMLQTTLRMNTSLYLIYFDLNNFKIVNDHFGHEMGDRVLRHMATELKNVLAGYGLLYRLGGDEFAAIVFGVGDEKIRELAERIELVSEQAPCGILVNVSAGIKKVTSDELRVMEDEGFQSDEMLEIILAETDRKMYEKKKNKPTIHLLCEMCPHGIPENREAV